MAGIYIHIPFCKQACHYCDFHFSTSLKLKADIINAILLEIESRDNFFEKHDVIETIYFGGGTPSILSEHEIKLILDKLKKHFNIPEVEITLEANPDDISKESLESWVKLGINRLSLGIQTFHDPSLKFLNRSHSSSKAKEAITLIQQSEIKNLSLDLIFGIHTATMNEFLEDLNAFIKIKPNHISTYCLTIEEGTTFGKWYDSKKLEEVDQETSSEQYLIILDKLSEAGYEQYEISNFSLPNLHSKHNSSYWKNEKYLGIGPSAHSYDTKTRSENIAHNTKYIKALNNKEPFYNTEELSQETMFNETILTQLRKNQGLDLPQLKLKYDTLWATEQDISLKKHINNGFMVIENGFVKLTRNGKLYADSICEDLFYLI